MTSTVRLGRTFTIIVSIFLFTTTFTVIQSPENVAGATYTNSLEGDYVLFHQNYTELGAVPGNIFLMRTTIPQYSNGTLQYNGTKDAVEFNTNTTPPGTIVGNMWIGNLSSVVYCTYYLKIGLNSDSPSNANVIIYFGGGFINVYLYANNSAKIISYYYEPYPTYKNKLIWVTTTNKILHLYLDYNGLNQSLRIYSGVKEAYTPFYRGDYLPDYPIPTDNRIRFSPILSVATWMNILLYEVKQTTSQYMITALPYYAQSFGVDGLGPTTLYSDGFNHTMDHGGVMTLWLDDSWNGPTQWKQNLSFFKDLIVNHSFELGIHFSEHLTALTIEQAQSLMTNEYNNVSALVGQPPTSWCSLGNWDNGTHAQYAWDNLGMTWRNTYTYLSQDVNLGLLNNASWSFFNNASQHYSIYPSQSHAIASEIGGVNDIDAAKFSMWVNQLANGSVPMVGFDKYHRTNINTAATFTSIQIQPGYKMRFTVAGYGEGNCILQVNVSLVGTVKVIRGGGDDSVPFVQTGDYLEFLAIDGSSYYLYSATSQNTLLFLIPTIMAVGIAAVFIKNVINLSRSKKIRQEIIMQQVFQAFVFIIVSTILIVVVNSMI